MILTLLGILRLSLADILDIIVVALLIYLSFKWIKGSSAVNIFTAIILLMIIRVLAVALNMKMLSAIMGTVIDVGAIALVVIFQPEIRHFLTRVGKSAGLKKEHSILDRILRKRDTSLKNENLNEIVDACFEMGEEKTGALIVILKRDSIVDIVDTGDRIDAAIRKRLIENIFFKNSPLHDGAMIIESDRIVAARCTLPITSRTDIPAHYGMRHKAAVGISEKCDADVIVVSEQTGTISLVRDGKITRMESRSDLSLLLSTSPNRN